MKKESSGKKSLLWLWITIGVVAALVVAGVLCVALGVFERSEKQEKFTSKLYWNIDRVAMFDTKLMMSARERADDGLYYVRFACGGEVIELPVADSKLIHKIDQKDFMCLKFDSDGTIIDVVDPEELYVKIVDKATVQQINGNNILANSSAALNGQRFNIKMNKNTGVYNVSNLAEKPGMPGAMEPIDQITVYGTDEKTPTDIYIMHRWEYSEVYWRVSERMYNATAKKSSRERSEDGYWYVDWAVNGEVVTLRTSMQEVVNAWDGYTPNDACCGMVFDEYGDVIDCFNAGYAARGQKLANNYDVTALAEDGSSFTATRVMFGTEIGKSYTSVIDENTKIYSVNCTSDFKGQEIDSLQLNDRVLVIADTMGKAKIIFVTNRMVDSPMYYNVSRNWSSGLKRSQRTPDADGWYHIKLAVKGREVTYRTRDVKLVDQIDSYGMSLFGLKLSGDIIVKVYDAVCVTGNYSFAANNFVDSVDGLMLATTNAAGTAANGVLAENCEVYDVSGHAKFRGAATTVRVGDRVICYQNAVGEITHIYIIDRYEAGTALYWNVNRYYSGGKSTRENQKFDGKPLLDEDGYYNFRVIKVGSTDVTWVKTKDIDIVNRMDSYGTPTAFSLRVNSEGVVTAAYPCDAASGGYQASNYLYVTHADPEVAGKWHIKAYSTGATGSFTVADDVKIYNFSQDTYVKGADALPGTEMKGSRTSIKVGDRVSCIAGRDGKIHTVMIVEREASGSFLVFRKGGKSAISEDGYWHFELLVDGKIKEYKTKDELIANKINSQSYAFSVKTSGDVITNVYHAVACDAVTAQAGGAYYDVVSIENGKLSLRRNRVGQSDVGATATLNLDSNYKVYTIDPNAPVYGAQIKLKVGDRIAVAYLNKNSKVSTIFVAYECTREGGNMGYCDHCGEVVHWENIAAGYAPSAGHVPEVAHYYYPFDTTTASSVTLGSATNTTEERYTFIVVDLNGKTITRKGTNGAASGGVLTAGYGNTVLVTDYSKAQTGKMVAENGIKYSGASGLLHIQAGSTMIVDKGVYDISGATGGYNNANAGLITVGGKLIVNGGTFKGWKETTNANWGGTVIGSWGDTSVTINGGTFIGGKATNMGGTFSINGDLTINGGKIYGGTASVGDNIRFANGNLTITGGEIDGGIHVSSAKSITLSGKPVIKAGTNYGLKSGKVKIDVSGLQAGASVHMNVGDGVVFTKDLASAAAAQALIDNGALKTAEEGMMLKVVDKAITCVSDGSTRTWTKTDSLPDSGNWKLGVNVTVSKTTNLSSNLTLDLNGYTITQTGVAWVYETGANKLTIDDLSGKTGDQMGKIVVNAGEGSFKAGVIYVAAAGEFILNNGILDASAAKNTYTGANAGTITIGNGSAGYGSATINGGKVLGMQSVGNGSAIGMMNLTSLTINGGEIVGNTVTKSINGTGLGGTIIANGHLTITGGKIYGGTASVNGDNIFVNNANANIAISGGEIDGGIYLNAYKTAAISGNVKIAAGDNYGLNIPTAKLVDMTGLTGGEIYVNATGVFTTDFANEDAANAALAFLKSGVSGEPLSLEGKAIKVGAASLPAQGTFKLTQDMTLNETLTLTGDLTIDLNGYTITSKKAPAIITAGKNLTITDTSGKTGDQLGKITTDAVSGNINAGVIYANSTTTFTLENGIIDGSNVTTTYTSANAGTITVAKNLIVNGGKIIGWKSSGNGGAIGAWGGTQITINGGEIVGGTVTKSINGTGYGGAIATNGGLTIAGGKIYGGTATVGGDNIRIANANSVVVISGGEIDGGVQLDNFSSVTISGTVKINDGTNYGLKIASGKKVNMTGLTGGKIYVDATDVFTTDFETVTEAQYAMAYLEPGTANKDFAVSGKAIKLVSTVDVTLSKTETTLNVGDEETITATATPAEATVTWTSSDETVATVVNGKITAVKAGTATITVQAAYGGNTATKTFTVTVRAANADLTNEAWVEWTDAAKLPTAGKYKLMTNITVSAAANLTGELWIDLNGYTITSSAVVYNTNGNKLVIDDLSGKTGDQLGTIKTTATSSNASGSVINVSAVANGSAGELILNNGIIDGTTVTNTKANATTGTVAVTNATNSYSSFTMNGGIIKGQKSSVMTSGVGGSALALHNGTTFVMNGGELRAHSAGDFSANVCCTGTCICAGTANITINGGTLYAGRAQNHGGAIYTKGNLTMNGGTIIGGQSQNSGAIYSEGTDVTILGGLIYGGKTVANPGNGGAVDKYKGTVTIGGNAVILGGVNVRGSAKLILKDAPVIDTSFGLQQRFDIRVNSGSIHLSDASSAAIQSTNGYYSLTYGTDGKVNGVKAFAAVTYAESATLPTTGAVKLTGDVTLTETLTTTGALYIDLNGHTVTYTGNAYAINAKHNLFITDTSTGENKGTIKTATANVNGEASVIYVTNGAKLIVAGGIIDGTTINAYSADMGGAVTLYNNSILVMLGGEIKGQRNTAVGSTGKGGGCVAGRAGSTIIMYAGDLTAYSKDLVYSSALGAAQGSCITTAGNTYIHGGTLTGNIVGNHGGTIYSTGNVYITGGLITGGTSTHSGNISCSGSVLSITGGTIINGTAKSGSALGGHNIDKYNGTLIIGGNAKIAGGVSVRGSANVVLKGNAVIDKTLQTAQKFNLRQNGTGAIYLNDTTGTALATAKANYKLTHGVNGQITGVTAE